MQAFEMSPLVVSVNLAVLDYISGRYARRYLATKRVTRRGKGGLSVLRRGREIEGRSGCDEAPDAVRQQQNLNRLALPPRIWPQNLQAGKLGPDRNR